MKNVLVVYTPTAADVEHDHLDDSRNPLPWEAPMREVGRTGATSLWKNQSNMPLSLRRFLHQQPRVLINRRGKGPGLYAGPSLVSTTSFKDGFCNTDRAEALCVLCDWLVRSVCVEREAQKGTAELCTFLIERHARGRRRAILSEYEQIFVNAYGQIERKGNKDEKDG